MAPGARFRGRGGAGGLLIVLRVVAAVAVTLERAASSACMTIVVIPGAASPLSMDAPSSAFVAPLIAEAAHRVMPGRPGGGRCRRGSFLLPLQRGPRVSQRRPRPSKGMASMSLLQAPLIAADDGSGLLAVTSLAALAGIKLEKTPVGKSLSGAVCAMLISSVLVNIGVVPSGSLPYISSLQGFVVRIATPLLLLGADLRLIFKSTGVMLTAFLLGSVGTCLGSCLGCFVFSPGLMEGLGVDAWKATSALTAKNIGGGLNFMAVAGQLEVSPQAIAASLTVDNILGLVYFPTLALIGRGAASDGQANDIHDDDDDDDDGDHGDAGDGELDSGGSISSHVTFEGLAGASAIACAFAFMADRLGQATPIPPTVASTLLTVGFATLLPATALPLAASGDALGRLLLFMFFASIGLSSGNVASALSTGAAIPLIGFGLTLYLTHMSVIFYGGKLFGIPLQDTILASNANIGNPATAAAMAASMGWKSRILPAILVGTMGNACGSLLGLTLGAKILSNILT